VKDGRSNRRCLGIGRAVAGRLRARIQVAVIDVAAWTTVRPTSPMSPPAPQVDTAVAAIREQVGPIWLLVNAGGVEGFRSSRRDVPEWSKVIDVNLNGVFHTIQFVRRHGRGRMGASSTSRRPARHSASPYGALRAANRR